MKIFLSILSILIIAVIALLVIAGIQGTQERRQGEKRIAVTKALKLIHYATVQMETDRIVRSDEDFGWPGDLKDVKSVKDFVKRLVKYDYLKAEDLWFFSGGFAKPFKGEDVASFSEANNMFKVYRVKETDPGSTIFMASKNFTYGQDLDPTQEPKGGKMFVIIRKDGHVIWGLKKYARNVDHGTLPCGASQETAEHCLP